MSSLREKLAAQRTAKLKQNKAVAKELTTANITNAGTATTPLDNIALQVSAQNDKLADHIAKQEEAGVYNFSGKVREVEGLDADGFILKMQALDAATVEKTPDIRSFSMQIRKNLHQYPELTHLLSDEQLGIITRGMLVLAGEATEPKTKGAKTRASNVKLETLGSMKLDDLGF